MVPRCRSRLLALCAVAALATSGACSSRGDSPEDQSTDEVPTIVAEQVTVTRSTIATTLVLRGTVTALPNEDVKVSALVPGRIDALTVAEGDTVREGQLVARLDTRMLRDQQRQADAARAQAAAQVENARLNLQRNEQLFTRGVAAGKEVEDARMTLAEAQAALDQAQAALSTAGAQIERADVRAPIAGQVVKRMVSVGEQVDGTAAAPIIEIANLERVELAANVPAGQLGAIKVGQSVTVSTPTYAARTFDGRIVAVAPAVDPVTNTALVRIRIDNPEQQLKVGMFAQADVTLAEHDQAVVVPAAALVREGDVAAVYVVKGETATRTPVIAGLESGGRVEVVSGIDAGVRILTTGVHGLGDTVKLATPK